MTLVSKLPRISLGSVGWILLLGFLGYRVAPQVQAAFGTGSRASVAPSFQLRTLEGESVSLEQYRGQVVQDFGGVRALPTPFLIDRQGRIRQEVKGMFVEPALRMAVGHLLAEEAPGVGTEGGAR